MSIDIELAFQQNPGELNEALASQGFTVHEQGRQTGAPGISMTTYDFFDDERSARGVSFIYHDGVSAEDKKRWRAVYPRIRVVALGVVSTDLGRNEFDLKKQRRTARFLRDRYSAILYDPQAGELMDD